MRKIVFAYVCFLTFCFVSLAVPIQWTGDPNSNGHWYDVIGNGVTWLNAKDLAEQSTYLGASGYLATVTSFGEQNFIANLISDAGLESAHIGGHQAPGSPEPGGGWGWITEYEEWDFTYWRSGEPSNNSPGEEALHMYSSDHEFQGRWNDILEDYEMPEGHGYVIEYVPEPSILLLFGLGGVALRLRSGQALLLKRKR